MNNRLNARLEKLERVALPERKPIVIWGDTEAEATAKMEAMIAANEIADTDRVHLVFWRAP